jgi:hypothetical protein
VSVTSSEKAVSVDASEELVSSSSSKVLAGCAFAFASTSAARAAESSDYSSASASSSSCSSTYSSFSMFGGRESSLFGGGESSLLGVAARSHQWRHPGDFPSLPVSDGKERLFMVKCSTTEDGEQMNGAGR